MIAFDHPFYVAFQAHLVKHAEAYIEGFASVSIALTIAGICTAPPLIPRTAQDWWTWIRNTVQTATPAARVNHENPTQQNSNQTGATTK